MTCKAESDGEITFLKSVSQERHKYVKKYWLNF